MAFTLPEIPYSYDALEPHIDARTMEIHHTKHHQGYTDKLNKAIKGTDLENEPIENILKNVSKHSTAVRNNGGGFYNHKMFWEIMSPDGGGTPTGDIAEAIKKKYGSYSDFKEAFSEKATGQFGSGWAWLISDKDGNLSLTNTPNQDNPLMDVADDQGYPLLGIDVWEHAYYLNYQNRRADYVKSFYNIINWDEVNKRYADAR